MMVGARRRLGRDHAGHQGHVAAHGAPEKMLLYQLGVSVPMLALGVLLPGERMTAMPSAWALGWLAYHTFWVVSHHVPGLVRADPALFGEPAFGLHIPDAIVRGRGRPFRPW